jgi:O-antigen/teichoic acid export membrane protein
VVQRVAANSIFFWMAVVMSPWRPKFVFSWAAARKLSRVSAGTSASVTISALTRQLPNLAIGRLLGAEQLGYYSLAQQVLTLPVAYVAGPITRVLFSLFSRLQTQPAEFRQTYERGQSLIVVVAAVIPGLIAAAAPEAVPALLGARWNSAVPLLQILAVPATLGLATTVVGSAIRSLGKPRTLVLVTSVPIAIQVVGLLIGLHRSGLVGAAFGWAVGAVLGFVYALTMVSTIIDIPVRSQLRPLWVAIPPVVAMVVATRGAMFLLAPVPVVLRLVVACSLGVAAYAAALSLSGPGEFRWIQKRVAGVAQRLRRSRRAPA